MLSGDADGDGEGDIDWSCGIVLVFGDGDGDIVSFFMASCVDDVFSFIIIALSLSFCESVDSADAETAATDLDSGHRQS